MGDARLLLALVFVSVRYNAVVPKQSQARLKKYRPGFGAQPVPPARGGFGDRALRLTLAKSTHRPKHFFSSLINLLDDITRSERDVLAKWTEIWPFVIRQLSRHRSRS
jgi:hypothetical protein